MAKRERIESAGESPPPQPTISDSKPESELPLFTAPSISPAGEAPVADVVPPPIDVVEMPAPPRERFKIPELPRFSFKMPELPAIAMPQIKMPHLSMPPLELPRFDFKLTPRRKRHAVLAATVMLAAGLGAVIGAAASGGFSRPAVQDVAGLQEQKAMQQTVARLTQDIKALKANVASTGKTTHGHVAVTSDKIIAKLTAKPATAEAPAQQADADITGSIPPTPTPLPLPRPAIAESAERPPVVKDWSIRFVRDGYVYVQGRGDVYEVVPGAPLPGLGPVKSIKQQDGHWVVATPKGLIVSQRDRKFFE